MTIMELLKTLAQQFIADTDNDGNIDVDEVVASISTLLADSSGGSQLNLGSIVSNLQGAGLSDLAASWLGDGENLAISPEQIGSLFNSDQLAAFGSALNLEQGSVQKGLSQIIPQLIDQTSSGGTLNELANIDLGGLADGLKKLF